VGQGDLAEWRERVAALRREQNRRQALAEIETLLENGRAAEARAKVLEWRRTLGDEGFAQALLERAETLLAPPQISHRPPERAIRGSSLKLRFRVTSKLPVQRVVLVWQLPHRREPLRIETTAGGDGRYEVRVPKKAVEGDMATYYIEVYRGGHDPVRSEIYRLEISEPWIPM
jgi:hypothetical protein